MTSNLNLETQGEEDSKVRVLSISFLFYLIFVTPSQSFVTGSKDVFLCQIALNDSYTGWVTDPEWQYVIVELEKRGITPRRCDQIWDDHLSVPLQERDIFMICQLALNENWDNWTREPEYQYEVQEAKRRGCSINDCDIISYGDKNPIGVSQQCLKEASAQYEKKTTTDNNSRGNR